MHLLNIFSFKLMAFLYLEFKFHTSNLCKQQIYFMMKIRHVIQLLLIWFNLNPSIDK